MANITGTAGDDILNGGTGTDTIDGGSGNDTITANGSDTAIGGFGNDTLSTAWVGEIGNVSLEGDAGNDTLNVTFTRPTGQSATASGGAGIDTFHVSGHGAATLSGGDGDDSFTLTNVTNVSLSLGKGSDTVVLGVQDASPVITVSDFQAGDGGDVLNLNAYLDGALAGWDHKTNPFSNGLLRLTASGADTILQVNIGGAWTSLVMLQNVSAASLTAANLSGFPPDGSAPQGMTITAPQQSITTLDLELGVEQLIPAPQPTITGLGGPDILIAGGDAISINAQGYFGSDNITLDGGPGDDQLFGVYGNSAHTILIGGSGDDLLVDGGTMTGGQGKDTFVYQEGDGDEIVTDFTPGTDTVLLYGYASAFSMADTAAGLVISLANGGSMTLTGVTKAMLGSGDITYKPGPNLNPPPVIADPTGTPVTTQMVETSSYTLAAGSSVWLKDYGEIVLQASGTIAGSLTKTVPTPGTVVETIEQNFGNMLTITSSGVVNVHVTASYGATAPGVNYFVVSGNGPIVNQGTITLVSDFTDATGIFDPADGSFTNSGTLHVSAAGFAVGAEYYGPAVFDNQAGGIIDVEGLDGALAVGLSLSSFMQSSFHNAGTILAASGSTAYAGVAVEIYGAAPSSFVNSGTITGDYALYLGPGPGFTQEGIAPASPIYTNSGQMFGVLHMSPGTDKIRNTGLINGAIEFGGGDDVYDGAGGTQFRGIYGQDGNDTLTGGDGPESLFGGEGNDTISGGGGDDFIDGGRGANNLDGGAGSDTLSFDSANAGVTVNLNGSSVTAPGLSDSIANFENVLGSIWNDTITGTDGANQLKGGAGDDVISAGAGDDFLTGGTGNDTLTGGAGNDEFLFSQGDGQDTITDFAAGGSEDFLLIHGYATYQSLVQQGNDTLVVLSATDSILLKNVQSAALTAADFSFSTQPPAPPLNPVSLETPGSAAITLVSPFTLAAGESLVFDGLDCGFLQDQLDADTNNALVINGSVSVATRGNVFGVESSTGPLSNSIDIGATGSLTVSNLGAVGAAWGIYVPPETGLHFTHTSPDITNKGQLTVISTTDATGSEGYHNNQTIENDGSWTVRADGMARGVYMRTGGYFANTAQFAVDGGTAAIGVQFDPLYAIQFIAGFDNSGAMTVTAADPAMKSIGVMLKTGQNHFDAAAHPLVNSGSITAGIAFQISASLDPYGQVIDDASVNIENSGTVTGDITVNSVIAGIHNTGTITGNILLGARDDNFSGADGHFNGTINAGGGDDTIAIGQGNATIMGGTGIDTVMFSGTAAGYSISHDGTNTIVTGAGGTTTLTQVEKLQFSDITLALGPPPHDINGDGKSDLTWQNTDGTAVIYFMNGSTIASATGLGNPGAAWKIKSTDDLNGDGKADLVWQNTDGTGVVYLMNGSTVTSTAGLGNPGAAWKIKATGDLNGDGKSDIVWQNTDGTAVVYFMNGGTISSVVGLGNPGASWGIKATGDFNGDGKSDILWQNSDGTVVTWLMNGSTVTSAPGVGNPGTAWHIRDTADFNGDGKSDILWQNDDGTTVVWFMNGATVTSAGGVGNPGSAWHIAGTGDINGDGKADITWQNDDGNAVVWLMNGSTVTGYAGLGNPGSSWHVVTG